LSDTKIYEPQIRALLREESPRGNGPGTAGGMSMCHVASAVATDVVSLSRSFYPSLSLSLSLSPFLSRSLYPPLSLALSISLSLSLSLLPSLPLSLSLHLFEASLRKTGVRSTCGPLSPYSGRDCVKSHRSSYTGLYPQNLMRRGGGACPRRPRLPPLTPHARPPAFGFRVSGFGLKV